MNLFHWGLPRVSEQSGDPDHRDRSEAKIPFHGAQWNAIFLLFHRGEIHVSDSAAYLTGELYAISYQLNIARNVSLTNPNYRHKLATT